MPAPLNDLTEVVNHVFDVLDLLVVRLTLLALTVLGAYALLKGHLALW